MSTRSTIVSPDTPLEHSLVSHHPKGTCRPPYLLGEEPPATTSFRCLPLVQPKSDKTAAGFPLVRCGDSVRPPNDRSERFISAPLIRRTLFDTSAFLWCPAGTPRSETGTTLMRWT
ncbi:hypothetical protein T08_4440 [Trichinella sp. T8]|nr:hypothetical protein T08_4440 [Trichinella sp. T8]